MTPLTTIATMLKCQKKISWIEIDESFKSWIFLMMQVLVFAFWWQLFEIWPVILRTAFFNKLKSDKCLFFRDFWNQLVFFIDVFIIKGNVRKSKLGCPRKIYTASWNALHCTKYFGFEATIFWPRSLRDKSSAAPWPKRPYITSIEISNLYLSEFGTKYDIDASFHCFLWVM